MRTHNIPFSIKKKKSPYIILNLYPWDFSKGPKNEFKTAVVNEPSVFEPLKVYCIFKINSFHFGSLTLLHSERPKLYTILAFWSATGLSVPLPSLKTNKELLMLFTVDRIC